MDILLLRKKLLRLKEDLKAQKEKVNSTDVTEKDLSRLYRIKRNIESVSIDIQIEEFRNTKRSQGII